MGLITNIEEAEKGIGKERAGNLAEFIELVNQKKYELARQCLRKSNELCQDARMYASLHYKEAHKLAL